MDINYVPYRVEGRQVSQYTAIDDCTHLRVARLAPEQTNSAALVFLTTPRRRRGGCVAHV